jgi:hypothetical protein
VPRDEAESGPDRAAGADGHAKVIADWIANSHDAQFDVIALQEVWVRADFDLIADRAGVPRDEAESGPDRAAGADGHAKVSGEEGESEGTA